MQSPDPQNAPKNKPPIAETVGATSAPFQLGRGATTIPMDIHAPSGPALLRADGHPRRVLLKIENVTSGMAAPSFGVYLNLPPGDDPGHHPELHAMTLSAFGLPESSQPSEHHPGDGLSFQQNVTDLYTHLSADKNWDGKTLRVSFVPIRWKDEYPLEVKVGRISLMFE